MLYPFSATKCVITQKCKSYEGRERKEKERVKGKKRPPVAKFFYIYKYIYIRPLKFHHLYSKFWSTMSLVLRKLMKKTKMDDIKEKGML